MLSGTLPYGARTFLPSLTPKGETNGDCLVGSFGAVYWQKALGAIKERTFVCAIGRLNRQISFSDRLLS